MLGSESVLYFFTIIGFQEKFDPKLFFPLFLRYSHEHDEIEQKSDTTRRDLLHFKRLNAEKEEVITDMEDKVEDAQAVLEQKKHETKKLAKEVKKLKKLLEEEKNKAQRSLRFNRILDHIDNID